MSPSLFKKLFKKSTSNQKKEYKDIPIEVDQGQKDINYLSEPKYIYFFNTELSITFQEELKDYLDVILNELSNTIQNNIIELCKYSIDNAIDFLECTGEALFMMYEVENKHSMALIEKWNSGDTEKLESITNRWYSSEDSKKIVQACLDSLHGKTISMEELYKVFARTILELKLQDYNFGNIYPVIKDELQHNPKKILDYMDPTSILINQEENQLIFTIEFINNWETEHGHVWIIKDQTPIYVGQDDNFSFTTLLKWDTIHKSEM